MASGGIAHLGDLHALHELVPHGLDGIIIDSALYEGAFSYSEAVAAGADRFDMFYWGPPE
jgi:phosphoribosylformimino-5-aminoimidazole carboxamide ribonucleotide (ProFAR) isomerase